MIEAQEKLNNEIGTKEPEKLTPEKVKIELVRIEPVEKVKKEKVICSSKHPSRDELIDISSVKYERRGSLVTTGLWYTEDEDGKIAKTSALAYLMNFLGAKTVREMDGMEVMTTEDADGYLCFKAY